MAIEEEVSETTTAEMHLLMMAKEQTDDLEKMLERAKTTGPLTPEYVADSMLIHLRLYERIVRRIAEENAQMWEARVKNLQFLQNLGKKI